MGYRVLTTNAKTNLFSVYANFRNNEMTAKHSFAQKLLFDITGLSQVYRWFVLHFSQHIALAKS